MRAAGWELQSFYEVPFGLTVARVPSGAASYLERVYGWDWNITVRPHGWASQHGEGFEAKEAVGSGGRGQAVGREQALSSEPKGLGCLVGFHGIPLGTNPSSKPTSQRCPHPSPQSLAWRWPASTSVPLSRLDLCRTCCEKSGVRTCCCTPWYTIYI